MLYRFTRTGGQKPVTQVDTESVIRSCFDGCTDEVKARLNRFFVNREQSIEFDFGEFKVRVERINV